MPGPRDLALIVEDRQHGVPVVDLVRYPEREAIPAELYRGFLDHPVHVLPQQFGFRERDTVIGDIGIGNPCPRVIDKGG